MIGKCLLLSTALLLVCPSLIAQAEPPATQPADSQEVARWPSRPRLVIWTVPGIADETQKRGRTDELQIITREKDAIARRGFDLVVVPADGLIATGHPDDESRRLQMACRALPDRIVVATLPIGDEGWEANHDRTCMERHVGKDAVQDVAKLTRRQHFANLFRIEAPAFALVLAHLDRESKALKPEAVAFYADAFAALCKEKNKRCYLWLSANSLRDAESTAIIRRVVETTKGRIEGYVWTDGPPMTAANEQPLDVLLGKIIELTPAEKTIVQYSHNKKLLTGKPKGVLEYAAACRQKKMDAFAVLAPWSQFQAKPWKEFYNFDAAPPQSHP